MKHLFQKTKINGAELDNRFVRSATWCGLAKEDGAPSRKLYALMRDLAMGGVGLIITGHAYVQKKGQAGPFQLGIHNDSVLSRLRELAKNVHASGGKVFIQLSHSGIFGDPALTAEIPYCASEFSGLVTYPVREMTGTDIKTCAESFGHAASRAKLSGFDGVQLHAGHGYLLNQFLSPFYNRREDEYGGSLINRSRFVLEVIRCVRLAVGDDFPVILKINSDDYLEKGLDVKDSIRAAVFFEKEGIDAVEISGGTRNSGEFNSTRINILAKSDEAYFKDAASLFKRELSIPVILVGGIRSYDTAETILNNNVADYISMSRPFICEPDLIDRWRKGDIRKSLCRSDKACLKEGLKGGGVRCVMVESSE